MIGSCLWGPARFMRGATAALRAFDPMKDLGRQVVDRDAAFACHSGLWLYFNSLDEAHAICQENEGHPERDFWHAIVHRREPDASNSKYWWRRVGSHPVLKRLVEEAHSLGYRYTNPLDFVDFCERVRDSGTPDEEIAKQVQLLEWRLLFDHCYRKAIG
jgi:hypothetical protein